jgi:undecaprenyl-diphosphatase
VDSILRLGDIAGKPPVSLALASAVGAIIARGSGVIAGLPVPLAAVLAFVAQKVGKRAFHRDRPPRALREGKTEPSYPSGHVTTTVAVGLTAAYVLSAEELVPASVSLPIALSLVGLAGGAKIYDERHWTSDVLGGVLAGVAVAALAIGARMLKERGSKGRPSSG